MFRRGGVANEGIMSGLVDRSVSSDATSGGLNSLVRPGYEEGGDVDSGGFWNSIVGRTLRVPVDYLAKPVANVINPMVNTLVGTEFEQMRTPYDKWDATIWNKMGVCSKICKLVLVIVPHKPAFSPVVTSSNPALVV